MKQFFLSVCCLIGVHFSYSQETAAGKLDIKGTVKDEKGNPVVAASVLVKGTNAGISSDSVGSFTLSVQPNAVLIISGMGFQNDTIPVTNQSTYNIVLKTTQVKTLREVEVVSKTNEQPESLAQEQVDNIVVQNMLDQFLGSQNINVGGLQLTNTTTINLGDNPNVPIGASSTSFSTVPSGTLYMGASIPVFQHKEETKGSRYQFDKWVHGSVIDTGNHLIDNKAYQFNYDKIAGSLLIRRDAISVIELNRDQIKAFILKDDNGRVYFFEKPVFDKHHFSLALVKDFKKYSLYKSTKTKFKKSDYRSDGLTESGNPYDEYVDETVYLVLMPGGKDFNTVVFKKKALRELFSNDISKVNQYFSQHDEDNVDENFVSGLVAFLNK